MHVQSARNAGAAFSLTMREIGTTAACGVEARPPPGSLERRDGQQVQPPHARVDSGVLACDDLDADRLLLIAVLALVTRWWDKRDAACATAPRERSRRPRCRRPRDAAPADSGGAESRAEARWSHPAWARSLRLQCASVALSVSDGCLKFGRVPAVTVTPIVARNDLGGRPLGREASAFSASRVRHHFPMSRSLTAGMTRSPAGRLGRAGVVGGRPLVRDAGHARITSLLRRSSEKAFETDVAQFVSTTPGRTARLRADRAHRPPSSRPRGAGTAGGGDPDGRASGGAGLPGGEGRLRPRRAPWRRRRGSGSTGTT